MARRSVTGQLNMFELFNNLEPPGEVQMVSLMPEDEPEPEPISEPVRKPVESQSVRKPAIDEPAVSAPVKKSEDEKVAMSRCYEVDGEKIEIAYINYNKVRITRGNKTPELLEFSSSKEAVDYYVEKMQAFEPSEE